MQASSRSLAVVVAALAAVLTLFTLAGAAQPAPSGAAILSPGPNPPKAYQWPVLDKVDGFKQTLGDAGFDLEQGRFEFWDLVKEACQGTVADALANNPWPNAYIIAKFPSGSGQSGLIDATWQLADDEALVLVGQTPPPAAYFSYSVYAAIVSDDPTTPDVDESRLRMGSPVGDTTNNGTIRTIGPDKFNRPIVYIITGSREAERRVRAAALKAGYPDAIINVETISPSVAPLGRGTTDSRFAFVHRVAVPRSEAEVEDYVRNANDVYRVFRVTPREPLPVDPEPVPVLRVRGTGHTEMALYPTVRKLRKAILDTYEQAGYGETRRKDLDTKIWQVTTPPGNRELITENPYVGLQRGYQVVGATRDNNYLSTYPNFSLGCDEYNGSSEISPERRCVKYTDEFVIVYGVNHQATGKATYSSFSIYADKDRWFGPLNGTTLSPDFDQGGQPGDSARRFLCPDDPSQCPDGVKYLYAWKVARECGDEPFCMEVKVNDDPTKPFTGIDGVPFACGLWDVYTTPGDPIYLAPFDLDKSEMFFLWRGYMEPATKVGADDNELVYDRAIYFGPYFTNPG
jgi:hypothetical protein